MLPLLSSFPNKRGLHRAHHEPSIYVVAMIRPIIFLDIDGVLNRTKHATHIRLDDDLVLHLKRLIDITNADIVLTTFWRNFRDYITYILHRHGISAQRIIDSTPGRGHYKNEDMLLRSADDDTEYASRHEEIESWLELHPQRENAYVILDDRPSAAKAGTKLAERFILTKTKVGLTEKDVDRAILLLLK